VLLVDDDQAEVGEGQEEGRAGADDEAGLAGGGGLPEAPALAAADAGMPFGGPRAEAGGDAVEEGAGERDLGQQDQGLAAGAQAVGDGLEVDLGLARAGDAAQERGRIAAGGHRGAEGGGGGGLGVGERRAGPSGSSGGRGASRGAAISSMTPWASRPLITEPLTPASRASSAAVSPAPPRAASASSRRARASVRRSGSRPVARSRRRWAGGAPRPGARVARRSMAVSGVSV
jgi:hypothetical protein